jgi:hypothetical protein
VRDNGPAVIELNSTATSKGRMSVTAICIRSKGTDLVAHSALDTLVRKMGFGDSLVSLWREEVWLLRLAMNAREAREITETLVERTGVFVNPNRHHYEVVASTERLGHGRERGRGELGVVVWSYEDPDVRPVMVAVRERLNIGNLLHARRLIFWWPNFSEAASGVDKRRETASSMASTLSRKEGLLANPHYQGVLLVESALSPADLLERIESAEARVAAI